MPKIPLDDFLSFTRTLEGVKLATLARKRGFTVNVVGEDLQFTLVSSGKTREHTRRFVESVLQQFGRTGAWKTTDYSSDATLFCVPSTPSINCP